MSCEEGTLTITEAEQGVKKEDTYLEEEKSVFHELLNFTYLQDVNLESLKSTDEFNQIHNTKSEIKEEDPEFDAYSDGIEIHRKYQLRTKQNIVVKEEVKKEAIQTKKRKRKNNDDGTTYSCTKCKKKFDTKTGLLNHIRMHQTIKKFTCALCQENFDTNTKLIQHKVIHKDEDRIFLCKTCEMAFTDHCDFLTHEISHTKRSTYKCIECNSYHNPHYIKIHIESHYDREIKCTECDKVYRSEMTLKTHVAENHIAKNRVECVECGKIFKSNAACQNHLSVHTGVKKFQCHYCGKGFIRKQTRIIHTRIHTKEKPYECDICHEKFYQQPDLKRHKNRHHYEIKFNCDDCGKVFKNKLSLTQHINLHRKENVLYCPICDKPCQNKQCLKAHMIYKHTTARPFKCDVCDLTFKDTNSIRKHNKTKIHKRAMFGAQKKEED